jgi:hypothetical protein
MGEKIPTAELGGIDILLVILCRNISEESSASSCRTSGMTGGSKTHVSISSDQEDWSCYILIFLLQTNTRRVIGPLVKVLPYDRSVSIHV